jgi:FkbM family methyltransferase
MVVIDVGVNVGTTILKFAKYSQGGKVFGFEPDIEMFARAKKNIALNNYKNISLIDKGLGSKATRVKLYKVHENNPGMNRVLDSSNLNDDYDFTEIEVIRLDDFVQDNNIEKIDLIKIDVEGYEFNVIQGSIDIIRNMRPIFFIELLDANLKEHNNSAEQLVRFFEDYNYQVFRADNNMPVTSKDNLNGCHYDVFCYPPIR